MTASFKPLALYGFGYAGGVDPAKPRLTGHQTYFDAAFNNLTHGFADYKTLAGFETRASSLAEASLARCMANLSGFSTDSTHLITVLPEANDTLTRAVCDSVRGAIVTCARGHLGAHLVQVDHLAGGQAALGDALARASESAAHFALIVLTDSYADRDRLDTLAAQDILFSANQPWGIIPGEAAGALLVGPASAASTGRSWPLLASLAQEVEPVPETCLVAETDYAALSRAVRTACQEANAQEGITEFDIWLTDRGQSRYRASELGHAILRATPGWVSSDLIPDCVTTLMGHCGAATGAAALVHMFQAFADRAAKSALITLGSPNGARCALTGVA